MHCNMDGSGDAFDPSSRRERRRVLILVACTLVLSCPLLMAQGVTVGSTDSQNVSLSKALDALRISAAKNGGVRVIVSLDSPERAAESTAQTEAAKWQFIARFQGPEAPAVQSIEGTPYVVLELTPLGVERLAADPAVKSVQQDSPERAQ